MVKYIQYFCIGMDGMKKEDILKMMDGSLKSSLERFNEACDDMAGAKYILASGKIAHVLQAIATSKPLMEFFNTIMTGFNFMVAFEKAKFRDELGHPYLKQPANPLLQVKFAFCLLFAIDTDKLELKTLLHTFFTHPVSANEEFSRFCDELLIPFQRNVNGILTGAIPLDSLGDDEPSAPAEPPQSEETAPVQESDSVPVQGEGLTETAIRSLSRLTGEIIGLVANAESLHTAEREELLLICDSFCEALSFGAPRTVKVMFIALKNTLLCSSLFEQLHAQYDNLLVMMADFGLL